MRDFSCVRPLSLPPSRLPPCHLPQEGGSKAVLRKQKHSLRHACGMPPPSGGRQQSCSAKAETSHLKSSGTEKHSLRHGCRRATSLRSEAAKQRCDIRNQSSEKQRNREALPPSCLRHATSLRREVAKLFCESRNQPSEKQRNRGEGLRVKGLFEGSLLQAPQLSAPCGIGIERAPWAKQ